jgi:site-specific recombinase XerD
VLLALVATGLRRSELIALDWGDLDTLRHTAATWLRQATGDARLVAEYLAHADLSTVSRYAHVAPAELHGRGRRHRGASRARSGVICGSLSAWRSCATTGGGGRGDRLSDGA